MTHLRALPTTESGESLADTLRRSVRAFTFAELTSLATARKARTAIARGEITRVLPDAYVATVHSRSFVAQVDAALLWAGPTAAVSGPAAMHLWGFLNDAPRHVDIVLPHPTHHQRPDWLRIRRLRWTPPVSRVNGTTVIGPAHALVLGFGKLPTSARSGAVHRAIATRLVTARGLLETLAAVPRVPARRELNRILEAALEGAESFLEEHGLRKVFNTSEFGRFLRQHRVMVDGIEYRLDMFDPSTMTDIELDGDAYHQEPKRRLSDIRRDAHLAEVGIQTVRISYRDLMDRPEWCRSLVRGVLVARSAR